MNGVEFLQNIEFTVLWLQPPFWALMMKPRSKLLDSIFLTSIMVGLTSFIPAVTTGFIFYPPVPLFYLYGGLGFVYSMMLFAKNWRYTQALAAAGLVTFMGSYFWEAPYLIRNAFITGPEPDWILHLLGVYGFWFIKDAIGWKTGWRSALYLGAGLFTSVVFMLLFPVPLVGSTKVWNSLPYLLNRVICTTIVFMLIKKEAPP